MWCTREAIRRVAFRQATSAPKKRGSMRMTLCRRGSWTTSTVELAVTMDGSETLSAQGQDRARPPSTASCTTNFAIYLFVSFSRIFTRRSHGGSAWSTECLCFVERRETRKKFLRHYVDLLGACVVLFVVLRLLCNVKAKPGYLGKDLRLIID